MLASLLGVLTMLPAAIGHSDPAAPGVATSPLMPPSSSPATPRVAAVPTAAAPMPTSTSLPGGIPAATTGQWTNVEQLGVGTFPTQIAYDSAKAEIFVSNGGGSTVSVISDATHIVVANVTVGSGPYGIAYDAAKGEVFVACSGSSVVSVISDTTNAVVATVTLAPGAIPLGVAYDAGTGQIFVADFGAHNISVIADSNNSVVTTINVLAGFPPFGLAYDSALGEIFVTVHAYGVVLIYSDTNDSLTGDALIGGGVWTHEAAYDSGMGEVFVTANTSTGAGEVYVIADSNNTVLRTISLALYFRTTYPEGVAYDAAAGLVFVSETVGDRMAVIADSNNTVIASPGNLVGANATGVVYDAGTNTVDVADSTYDLVIVFGLGYPVTFTETGLTSATLWTFWLNGTTAYGPTNLLAGSVIPTPTIVVANGSFTFTMIPVPGFSVSPVSGPILVAGAPVTQTVTFSEEFTVTFSEAGLPGGTAWSVTMNGVTVPSSSSSLTFTEVNGTYTYSAGAGSGYAAVPASGTLVVNGANVSRSVSFDAVFPIWFNETGLPTGTNWSVTIVGTGSSAGSIANSSTTASIGFVVPGGYTGSFTISRPSGYASAPGSGTVSMPATGPRLLETVTFTADPSVTSFVAHPANLTLGDSLTLTVVVTGGAAPFAFVYSQLPSGCATENATSVTCAPAATGHWIVVVSVTDRLGRTALGNVNVTVSTASTAPATFLGLPPTEGYGLIAAIVAIIVIAALVVLMRRRPAGVPRSGSSPAASSAPPAAEVLASATTVGTPAAASEAALGTPTSPAAVPSAPTGAVKFCSHCGASSPMGSGFCSKCGQALAAG